ncbi:hypothetical protein IFM89_014673 [Coptis chinensis]|uniref:Uncharacterized protein n=1 Tax=Coptis chinensis TaxID=261450 RepID=A0A835LQC0_9MAGN|nr:hypothetical protein IFM89_014673 [Coptis chinensis]
MTELAEKLISETASSKFKFLLGRVKAEKQLPSDSKQQLISKRCIQQSLLQSEHIADHRIAKYLRFVNLDEKFLQHCLDLVEFRAANSLSMICSPAVPCNVAVNLRSSKQVFYDNHLEPHQNMRRNRSDLGNFVVHCPSATQSGQWILKTVDENECGKNVLNDSLLCHLGTLGSNVMGRVGLIDVKGTKDSGFMSFPSRPSLRSLQKPETGTLYVENPRSGLKSLNKRIFAISNGVSTSSDQSLSSSATFSQGTLQHEWKNGVPYLSTR